MAKKEEVKHYDYAKLKHKSLDDVLKHIEETHFPKLEHTFTDYDNFRKESHYHALKANILKPSFDQFYTTVEKELKTIFGEDGTKSIHKKDKEVKTALAKGMMDYLRKSRPEIHQALMKNKHVSDFMKKGDSVSEAYELIAHNMDTYIMGQDLDHEAGTYSSMAKQVAENDESTVNSLKSNLEDLRGGTYRNAWGNLVKRKFKASVGRWEPWAVAHYMKEKVIGHKDSGHHVHADDEYKFLQHNLDRLMRTYEGVKTGNWGTDEQGNALGPSNFYVRTKLDDTHPKKKYEAKKEK
jgi:hypothetical protein